MEQLVKTVETTLDMHFLLSSYPDLLAWSLLTNYCSEASTSAAFRLRLSCSALLFLSPSLLRCLLSRQVPASMASAVTPSLPLTLLPCLSSLVCLRNSLALLREECSTADFNFLAPSLMNRGIRNPGVNQCLSFCSADLQRSHSK